MARYRFVSLTPKARSASVTVGTLTEPLEDPLDEPLDEEPLDGDVVDFPQSAPTLTIKRPAAIRYPAKVFRLMARPDRLGILRQS
jgi:hypothetical protein